jgi:hypothetical protein
MTITPASIRNRNPGAQEPGPSSRKFGSTSHEVLRWTYKGKPATNKIATFPTGQHGAAAMFDLLNRRYTGKTIEKAIATWCGGYYASAYAKALEANGGVKPTDKLTKELVANPEFAIPLCKAMARVEAGRDFPMSDDEWLEAHRMAFGGAAAPEFTPDNDVPSPGPKARAVAAAKEIAKIAVPTTGVVGTGAATVATQKTEAPAPKPTTKEQLAKTKETAKEVRETIDVAKDYATWGKGVALAAYDQWMVVVPLTIAAGLAIFWPKIRERF